MMFIDCDGYTLMPLTNDVLEAARIAKEHRGRLRLVTSGNINTSNVMVGCTVLGDYTPAELRAQKGKV